MKRMNSPGYSYARTTTASRRQERPINYSHISVAFKPNPMYDPELAAIFPQIPPFLYDRENSHGTFRKH